MNNEILQRAIAETFDGKETIHGAVYKAILESKRNLTEEEIKEIIEYLNQLVGDDD